MSLSSFVGALVKECVNEPEAVSVEEVEERGSIVYRVTVSQGDIGRIIGKDGRVISAIRHVVAGAGSKAGERTMVKIVEA